jgi:hypothetical protein
MEIEYAPCPEFDKDNPTQEQIEALKAWYRSPSPIKVKWKEIVPEEIVETE